MVWYGVGFCEVGGLCLWSVWWLVGGFGSICAQVCGCLNLVVSCVSWPDLVLVCCGFRSSVGCYNICLWWFGLAGFVLVVLFCGWLIVWCFWLLVAWAVLTGFA